MSNAKSQIDEHRKKMLEGANTDGGVTLVGPSRPKTELTKKESAAIKAKEAYGFLQQIFTNSKDNKDIYTTQFTELDDRNVRWG